MNEDREKYIKLFKEESGDYLERLNNLIIEMEEDPSDIQIITEAFRIFHTLKGMAASLGFKKIENISHNLEELLLEIKESKKGVDKDIINRIFKGMDIVEDLVGNIGTEKEEEYSSVEGLPLLKIKLNSDIELPAASATLVIKRIEKEVKIEEIKPSFEEIKKGNIEDTFWIRCYNEKRVIDILNKMSEVKEVVVEKEDVSRIHRAGIGGIRVNVELLDRLQNIVGELIVSSSQLSTLLSDLEDNRWKSFIDVNRRTLKELQDVVTKIRLVPLSLIFNKFPRYVRDLSEELDKKVSIEIFGSEIEVDRSLLEGISEPLIHLIRNAVSHGIETPRERERLKKPITGKVKVSARRAKDEIFIEVSDDGKGIDENEVINTALREGLIKEEEISSLSSKEILHFLLIPGFTTDKKASEISGRGIGLDVVKQIVRSVGGSVDIKTERNRGTTVTMKMPLSMAIIRVYLFQSNRQLFALPMTFIDETLMIPGRFISSLMGRDIILLRREVLPVYHFSKMIGNQVEYKRDDKIYSSLIVKVENERFVLIIDRFRGSCDVVIKPLPEPLNKIKEYTGITIIGDGQPCLIIDLPSFRYRRTYENTGS